MGNHATRRRVKTSFVPLILVLWIVGAPGQVTFAEDGPHRVSKSIIDPFIEAELRARTGIEDKSSLVLISELNELKQKGLSRELLEICSPLRVCGELANLQDLSSLSQPDVMSAVSASTSVVYPGNDLSIRLVIGNLYDVGPDPGRRARYVEQLIDNARPIDLLRSYSSEIEAAIDTPELPNDFLLLSMLDVGERVRGSILANPDAPLEARAMLGSGIAERELVEEFDECVEECEFDDFGSIFQSTTLSRLATWMVRIGKENSRRSLSLALSSPRMMGKKGTGSVAYCVLEALRRENPNDEVLAQLENHIYFSESQFREEAHQTYLSHLEKHLNTEYGLKVEFRVPFLYCGLEMRDGCGVIEKTSR